MPEEYASGKDTIFHYKGNITPPKDWNLWLDLVQQFAKAMITRYGLEEVRQWYFETWNEPNCGFWSGTFDQYLQLLQTTSTALKSVDSQLRVGGPATCRSALVNETLTFVQQNNVKIDFISTHEYPTDVSPVRRSTMKEVVSKVRALVPSNLELLYTEYNDGLYGGQTYSHDSIYASAYAIHNIIDLQGLVDVLSWWTFSDVFEEGGQDSALFHQGYGMQTLWGIAKPVFRAFELLHSTGNQRIVVNQPTNYPTVDLLATRNQTHIVILMTNHDVLNTNVPAQDICINITGLSTSKQYSPTLNRIDENNANPLKAWQTMGSPTYPTKVQLDSISKSSEMSSDPLSYTVNGPNEIMFTLHLLGQGVAGISFQL